MSYWQFAPYVSVGERKAKAAKKLKELQKKDPDIKPIIIEGSAIAKSWWGKSWNKNLEKYADFSNRIGRGRSYVRHGAVIDLRIDKGVVNAQVQGSDSVPYAITIKIKKINKETWSKIVFECDGKMDSLHELLAGSFPKSLTDVFTAKDRGLFPSQKEIDFDCDCPDGASMCKHIAAVLYGIGARLDNEPKLFFTLRNVKVEHLVSKVVKDKTKKLLDNADKKSARVIDDADLSSVFGIELEENTTPKKRSTPTTKVTTKKKTLIKAKPKANANAKKTTEKEKVKKTKITAKDKKTPNANTGKATEKMVSKKTAVKITKTTAKDKKPAKSMKTTKVPKKATKRARKKTVLLSDKKKDKSKTKTD